MNKYLLIPLVLAGAGVIAFAILYFSTQNALYAFASLLCVGLVNIVNGFLFYKNGTHSVSTIFFIGGSLLTLLMMVVILFRLI